MDQGIRPDWVCSPPPSERLKSLHVFRDSAADAESVGGGRPQVCVGGQGWSYEEIKESLSAEGALAEPKWGHPVTAL